MTHQEYLQLSADLQQLLKTIPLHWGAIQNDGTDRKMDLFQINSFAELEIRIQTCRKRTRIIFEGDGFYGNVPNATNIFFVRIKM